MAREQSSTKIWQQLGSGLAALMLGAGAYLAGRAHEEPPAVERHSAEPAKQPPFPPLGKPDPTPTTDEGVIASRTLEARLNPLLAELQARAAVEEKRTCLLEQELRYARMEIVALQVGARNAKQPLKVFRESSEGWAACFTRLEDVERRRSLRDAAADALGR